MGGVTTKIRDAEPLSLAQPVTIMGVLCNALLGCLLFAILWPQYYD